MASAPHFPAESEVGPSGAPDLSLPARALSRSRSEDGFSLIELLVVVLIFGILAAMAIPAYLSQRAKAQDAEAKNLVASMHVAIKTYLVESGDYAGANLDALVSIEPTLNDARDALRVSATQNRFTLEATSESGNRFTLAERNGNTTRSCRTPGSAGCYSGGDW